jgi:RNA 3'-terminal phosphate cyclase
MYTLAGAVGFNSDEEFSMSASVESTTLVPGATLSLAWEDANFINSGAAIGDGAGVNTEELGVIVAKAVIAF